MPGICCVRCATATPLRASSRAPKRSSGCRGGASARASAAGYSLYDLGVGQDSVVRVASAKISIQLELAFERYRLAALQRLAAGHCQVVVLARGSARAVLDVREVLSHHAVGDL